MRATASATSTAKSLPSPRSSASYQATADASSVSAISRNRTFISPYAVPARCQHRWCKVRRNQGHQRAIQPQSPKRRQPRGETRVANWIPARQPVSRVARDSAPVPYRAASSKDWASSQGSSRASPTTAPGSCPVYAARHLTQAPLASRLARAAWLVCPFSPDGILNHSRGELLRGVHGVGKAKSARV